MNFFTVRGKVTGVVSDNSPTFSTRVNILIITTTLQSDWSCWSYLPYISNGLHLWFFWCDNSSHFSTVKNDHNSSHFSMIKKCEMNEITGVKVTEVIDYERLLKIYERLFDTLWIFGFVMNIVYSHQLFADSNQSNHSYYQKNVMKRLMNAEIFI